MYVLRGVGLAMVLALAMSTLPTSRPNRVAHASVFVVNQTIDNDDRSIGDGRCDTLDDVGFPGDQCTLRAAIQEANATPTPDQITFDLFGSGPHLIRPGRALPWIVEPVTLDATTECPGSTTPCVELSGTFAPGASALTLTGGNSTVRGLAITQWGGHGISLERSDGNVVIGNVIGLNRSGTAASPNSGYGIRILDSPNNRVGGTTISSRNVISGNGQGGIGIFGEISANNRIVGNFVGTDASGMNRVGNGGPGILLNNAEKSIVGDGTAGGRNIVSGNDGPGIRIQDFLQAGSAIVGNYLGADVTGAPRLGNAEDGILLRVGASNMAIGGAAPGAGNRIVGNAGNGIRVFESDGAEIVRNVIEGNGLAGVRIDASLPRSRVSVLGNSIVANGTLGIDLVEDSGRLGITNNDSCDHDDGSNGLQNFPELRSVVVAGGTTTVSGRLNSTPSSSFTIELFVSPVADPSGHGEGATLLGQTSVSTNAGCLGEFSATLPGISTGQVVTATATDPFGRTSELSAARGPEATPGACTPRPNVQVRSRADGAGRLRTTLSAQTSPALAGNRLRELRLTRTSNGIVDVVGGPVNLAGSVTVPLPSLPQSIEMLIRRPLVGRATTIHLVVVDDCGPWSTFVGGGPESF